MRRRRFKPRHVGATLQSQFLDDYQLTAEEFASAIDVPHERVERLLAGDEPVDADLALRLARLFGGSADGWQHWQSGYELWNAHERIGAKLGEITPHDLDTRRSVLEDEPLEPELIEELRRRVADVHDSRRWVVVSVILGEDVPLHEESISRMFYNVESNCYSVDLLGATPFKSQKVAEAVATALGRRKGVIEVTKQDLDRRSSRCGARSQTWRRMTGTRSSDPRP
jgi:addiction module HigA family antidote